MNMIGQGWWFIPNLLNNFTVCPRNNLKANSDGSIMLYFQNESAGKDKEANWPPARQSILSTVSSPLKILALDGLHKLIPFSHHILRTGFWLPFSLADEYPGLGL
jgi:hypothetical protein